MAMIGRKLKIKIYLITIFILLCTLVLSKDLEELSISRQILSEYKKNECKFNKDGLIFREYKNEYLIISGFWKKDKPYGKWIEKTYTNIVINDQCQLDDKRIFKSYSEKKLTRITYIDNNYKINGFYDSNGKLYRIFYETRDSVKVYEEDSESWYERDMKLPYFYEGIKELYKIDKEKN